MSVLLVACHPKYYIMVSDQRIVSNDDNGNYTILSESYPKCYRVNSRVCFGGAGNMNILNACFKAVDKYNRDHLSFERINKILTETIYSFKNVGLGYVICLGGMNKTNDMAFNIFDSKHGYKKHIVRSEKDTIFWGSFPDDVDSLMTRKLLSPAFPPDSVSVDTVLEYMSFCVHEVSKVSKFINSNVHMVGVRR
jgi:hypothetical protein